MKREGGADKTVRAEAEMHVFVFGTCILYWIAVCKYLHSAEVNELLG